MPKTVKGVLDLRDWDFEKDGIVNLDGEWEFYWKEKLGPRDFANKTNKIKPDYVKVPSIWNNYQINGKLKSYGYATFRLRVLLNNSEPILAINVKRILSAYSVIINGKNYEHPSTFGTSAKTSVPYEFSKIITALASKEGEIEIILHISNYHRWRGGISDKVLLGLSDDIIEENGKTIALDLFIFGSIFIISLYHLALFLFQRKEYAFLFFGLMSFITAIAQIVNNTKYLVAIFPNISWELIVKIDFLTVWLMIFFFLKYIQFTFPKDINKLLIKIMGFITIIICSLIIFSPAAIYSPTMNILTLYIVIVLLYIILIMTKILKNKRESGLIFFIGFVFILLSAVNDAVYSLRIITNTFVMFPFGVFIFFFSQSYLLAGRYSDTFKRVTVLSEDLKELNESLEQKVEDRTKELQAAKEVAEQANRYKTDFLAHMTHDLRTPLHVVIGILDMFSNNEYIKEKEELEIPVDIALKSGERQLQLVNSILDVGKIESGKIDMRSESFEFKEIYSGLNKEMDTLLKNKVVDYIFENKVKNEDLIIKADKLKLTQIITNLLGNAVKFTEKGDIKLKVSIIPLAQPQLGEGLRSRGEGRLVTSKRIEGGLVPLKDKKLTSIPKHKFPIIMFEILDTGIGMSAENAARVFESYTMIESKLQSRVQGSGLGLTICKGFVEALGGKIWVESKLGKGSVFKFWIPLIKGRREKIRKEIMLEEIDFDFLRTIKVMVVDDDKFNCMFAEMVLKNRVQYKIFDRGQDVVDTLKKEDFDILLTDFHMPEMDGLEVLTAVRKFNKKIPIVVLTASAIKGTRQSFLEKGFTDYFTKPFKEKELLVFIQKKLKRPND
ncbi:response regulator [Candidatus Margulisiibacteriota bacterium]